MAASRQFEGDLNQLKGAEAEGMTSRMKEEQSKIYQNSTADLTEDQKKIFDNEITPRALNTNIRVSGRERQIKEQRIRDNFEGKSISLTVQALDNYKRPQLFYQDLEEASRLKNERLKLDGVDENLIKEKDRVFKSQTVREAITRISTESLESAELWFKEASKKKELTFNDSFELKVMLDKRKNAKDKIDLQVKVQTSLDKLFADNGVDQKTILDLIREKTSGEFEEALISGAKVRFKERSDQDAENQRKFLSHGKVIIDQTANASEAVDLVDFIMSDPNASIATAKTLQGYIDAEFVTPDNKRKTNPAKLQEAFTRINKTFQGIASQKEVLDNSDQIIAEYKRHLSSPDLKKIMDFHRKGGFLGGNTYESVLKSFSDLEGKTPREISKDDDLKFRFNQYLDHVIPRLPSDKAVSDFDLRTIGSGFFISEEGETPTPNEAFFGLGLDETYQEAQEAGRDLFWLPTEVLEDENAKRVARQLLIQENEIRKAAGKSAIVENDLVLLELYKEQVLRFPHKRETR